MQFSNSESSDFLPFRRQEVHRLQPVVSDGVAATKRGLVALAGVEQGGPNRLQLRHSLLVMDNEPWRLGCQTFSLLHETSATICSRQGQQWTLGVVNRSKAWDLGHSCTALIQCQRQWHFPSASCTFSVPVPLFQCQLHFSSASTFPVQCELHFPSASCTFSSASCTFPVPALFQRSGSCTCPAPAALFQCQCTSPVPVALFQCQCHFSSASCTSPVPALFQCSASCTFSVPAALFPVPVALAQCHTVFHALKKVLPRNIPKDFQNVSNNFTCTIAYSYEHVRRSFCSVNKPG